LPGSNLPDAWTNLFAFYGLHLSDFERDQAMFAPPKTQLAPDSPEAEETIIVPVQSHEGVATGQTNLFSKLADIWGEVPVRLIQQMDLRNGTYGFVGMSDNRMSPLIRPGSIVQIDQNQRKILNVKWENEYDRPIYFLELRGAYLCSWCEIGGGYLSAILIPIPKRSTPLRVSPGGGYRRARGLRDQPSRGIDLGCWSILEKWVFSFMLLEVS